MPTNSQSTRVQSVLLWVTISVYCGARFCQLLADRLPILLTVVLHVVPPALFAAVHGRRRYGGKGFAVFAVICLGTAAVSESLSLRTGIPFGSYVFTGVMGPEAFGLPFLLVLAYLGMAYCSWTLALVIMSVTDKHFKTMSVTDKHFKTRDVLFTPPLASSIFLAWDLAMEADWSTVDRAWIWRDGGFYFGVPFSNFVGWFITAWVFFSLFALYLRRYTSAYCHFEPSFWRYSILLYGICAFGNPLIQLKPMASNVVTDATGRQWQTQTILLTDSIVSIFIMGGFVALALAQSFRADRLHEPLTEYSVCTKSRLI